MALGRSIEEGKSVFRAPLIDMNLRRQERYCVLGNVGDITLL